jgi:membrane protease YdiL (CAAX protease family)
VGVAVVRAMWLLAAWMFVLAMFMLFRPPYNALWVAGVVALVVWWHVLRPGVRDDARERTTLRLRPVPRWAMPWLARAVWPMLVANFASLMLAVALRLSMGNTGGKALEKLQHQGPWGWTAMYLWMLVFAPVLEEMVCRGWLQRPLERRLGPTLAIGLAAAVFAAMHMQPAGFANRFILGLVCGYAVWVTGSIWAGVAMHAANNAITAGMAALAQAVPHAAGAKTPKPGAFNPGPLGLIVLAVVLAFSLRMLARIGREMLVERRRQLADSAREAAARSAAEAAAASTDGSAPEEGMAETTVMTESRTAAPASLRALLQGIVDYAGLFPPAALAMPEAVEKYAEARRGADAWMLGRFVLPVKQLSDFAEAAEAHLPVAGDGEPWRLSALLGHELAGDFAGVEAFNQEHAGRAVVDCVEMKAPDPVSLAAAARQVPQGMTAYFELAPGGDLDALLAAVAETGTRAKIRTGGVTADAFPAPADVLRFLAACVRAEVPLKATAGLHHPLRAEHRLTYEPDAPRGTMFGFLNVFLAAAFLRAGVPADAVAPLLEEGDASAMHFSDEGVEWRGHRLSADQIRAARQGFATSFGSCSFDEPAADLRALSLL